MRTRSLSYRINHQGLLRFRPQTLANLKNQQCSENSKDTYTKTSNPKCYAAGAAAVAMTTTSITTAAGYTMSPLLLTSLSNAPLLAFAFIQASGISPIKQIWKEKKTGDLSPFPFISLFTNCSVWTLYGFLVQDQTLIIANSIGILFGAGYSLFFTKYTHLSMLKYYAGSGALLSFMLSSPFWLGTQNSIQLLGMFGCTTAVVLMASPLAVVGTVIKQKSTKAMPFPVSAAMTFNGLCWGSYGWFVAGDPYVWLPNILGCASGFLQLSLFAIY